jgi:ubiquinone/menaquinone biosynthesis C-methylase UbiE
MNSNLTRDIKKLFHSKYRNIMVSWFTIAFGNKEDTAKALEYMINENHSDEMIYALTHQYKTKYRKKQDMNKPEKRTNVRKKQIQNLLEKIDYPKNLYLDIGCETMIEPEEYADALGISAFKCINIEGWVGAYEKDTLAVTSDERFSYYDGTNIPLEDNTVSVITINMVIHHVEEDKKEELLRNVYKVLEPNGLLIIREHGSYSPQSENGVTKKEFDLFLDFIHHFFDSVINKEYRWVEDYYTTYTSANFLRKMIENIGFESIKVNDFNRPDKAYQEVFRIKK